MFVVKFIAFIFSFYLWWSERILATSTRNDRKSPRNPCKSFSIIASPFTHFIATIFSNFNHCGSCNHRCNVQWIYWNKLHAPRDITSQTVDFWSGISYLVSCLIFPPFLKCYKWNPTQKPAHKYSVEIEITQINCRRLWHRLKFHSIKALFRTHLEYWRW